MGERTQPLIHVADLESDIFAYSNEAEQRGAYFLSRIKMNRLAEESSLFEVMVEENDKLQYDISLFDRNRKKINATIGVTAKRVLVHPPETAKDRYPNHSLVCIRATEIKPPKGRKPISWSVLTNLLIQATQDLRKVLEWYKLSWLVSINRSEIEACPSIAFTPIEIKLLQINSKRRLSSLQDYIQAVAMHGGYLGPRNDPPPGLIIVSRGLRRLKDIVIGYELALKDVGN